MKKILISFLFVWAFNLQAQGALDVLDTPPPDDVFVAAKIDPKLYKFSFGLEGGWAFANPFIDDFSFGTNLYYLPCPQLRLGLVGNMHLTKQTSFATTLDSEIGLKDRFLSLAKPQLDVLIHIELRALHGLVRLFYVNTLDYEAGLFLRVGFRKSNIANLKWINLLEPGISQTLLSKKNFNFRLLLASEIQNKKGKIVTQGAVVHLGAEWRF